LFLYGPRVCISIAEKVSLNIDENAPSSNIVKILRWITLIVVQEARSYQPLRFLVTGSSEVGHLTVLTQGLASQTTTLPYGSFVDVVERELH
jgi:hypothetical protein